MTLGFTTSATVIADQNMHWIVEPAWRDRLLGPDAPDWFALETSPAAEHVKAGHEREVWRVRLGSFEVFAKVRHAEPGLNWVGAKVARLTSSVRREWMTAQGALAKGVPVVHFVALLHRRGDQPADVLISEAIPNAQTLAAAWAGTRSGGVFGPVGWRAGIAAPQWPDREPHRQIIRAVARLFADAHQRGFAHHDNHPHNILVYPKGDDLAAVFVDVIPASLSRGRASYARILASLAHLDQYFHRVATRTERLRFLRAYLTALHASESLRDEQLVEHRLVPAILRERAWHALRLARRRDQRIWRKGKYFTTFELQAESGRNIRATVVLDLERRHLFPESETPDRSEDEWRNILGSLMHDPYDSKSAEELARHGLQCETMRPASFFQRLRWTLFGSPHRRAFARAHLLRHRDIRAPLLLAYLQERHALISRTFLLYSIAE